MATANIGGLTQGETIRTMALDRALTMHGPSVTIDADQVVATAAKFEKFIKDGDDRNLAGVEGTD